MTAPTYELLTDDIGWGRVYFARGDRSPGARVNEVTDPPYPGYGQVIVMDGDKSCTLLCPFTFSVYNVTHRSMEYASLRKAFQTPSIDRLASHLKENWAHWAKLGSRVDFGMVASVLRKMGFEAPVVADLVNVDVNEPPAQRKGKAFEEELKKPVKKSSKRGKVLSWFLADGGGPKSIQACMAEFGISRSNALSYLFMLNKDHGIGYVLGGNTATVVIPGNVNPFEE